MTSVREEIQDRLARFCEENNLDQPYGVLAELRTLANGKKARVVLFCRSRTLDGVVIIYSPTFFQVKSNRTPSIILKSPEAVEQYIADNFVY